MHIINNQGVVDSLYSAEFKGVTVSIYAVSDAQAKQRAIEFFKPKKREKQYLVVSLLKAGNQRNKYEPDFAYSSE